MKKISIGIAGLGFGSEFLAIYKVHPNVDKIAICTRNENTLKGVGDRFDIPENMRFTNYDNMVSLDNLDAIHIVTPIAEHATQSIKALEQGKHTACTVPMATTIEDLEKIIQAKTKSDKYYMMMETSLFTREFMYVKNLVKTGKLGRIQYIKGEHMQNMSLSGWGDYWKGFPPFLYGTHVLSPILDLLGTAAESVRCVGSGQLPGDKTEKYGCPYAVESATFKMKNCDVVAQAHRCLFDTVRQVRESFDIYGDKMSFEWEATVDEGHTLFYGIDDFKKIHADTYSNNLPESIKHYSLKSEIIDPTQPSYIQGTGHGGSHPHLCHEFVMSIVEEREPYVDAFYSANITAAGICAHNSAMALGKEVIIPYYAARQKNG